MVLNVTSMLERLNVQSVSDQLYLEDSLDVFGTVTDETNDSVAYRNPVIDKALENSGTEGYRMLTNFTPAKFEAIWGIVETPLTVRWLDGKGHKSKTTPKDALFMTLVILKNYQTWDKDAVDFDVKAPTLEKMIMRIVDVVSPALYEALVPMPSMQALVDRGAQFSNYAKYATDVKFQPSHRPTGRFGEK
ncbi:hypothetical protein DYB28_011749 [Aphanomyces astaci]|uniref:Uncharacterized protein n=1 Tax=Aphanomyces astaci TaxID=112090 RepID=A0A397A5D5_APHAT|nr:hypothetical protein AaE_000321 [Aphanomyces astaci]RHY03110.1 hypothetical protein DYB36_002976 [Aphanomyces astaci]RHY35850.1 hypothetical protein DYB25_014259 [Aphanomyces astaci]RHY49187.1 hypothetical protein DYB30_008502 [Aphanomyces astaci]RHZ32858.1 hypothetical protein DYB31_015475 [Aphanomyces astaci]